MCGTLLPSVLSKVFYFCMVRISRDIKAKRLSFHYFLNFVFKSSWNSLCLGVKRNSFRIRSNRRSRVETANNSNFISEIPSATQWSTPLLKRQWKNACLFASMFLNNPFSLVDFSIKTVRENCWQNYWPNFLNHSYFPKHFHRIVCTRSLVRLCISMRPGHSLYFELPQMCFANLASNVMD